jgi:hypothetical protein
MIAKDGLIAQPLTEMFDLVISVPGPAQLLVQVVVTVSLNATPPANIVKHFPAIVHGRAAAVRVALPPCHVPLWESHKVHWGEPAHLCAALVRTDCLNRPVWGLQVVVARHHHELTTGIVQRLGEL